MVLTFGTRLPNYPRNVISLSPLNLELKSSFGSFGASVYKVALANARTHDAKLPLPQVEWAMAFDRNKNSVRRSVDWSIRSSADRRDLDPISNSGDGRSRLTKTVQDLQSRLNNRIQELRKKFPRKFLSFLVGFYCATAFSTVIGQTGDWDILSAALAVAVVEGIGALMYKASVPLLDKIRNLVVFFNYWKAGLTLGLFLDSFKY